MRPTPQEISIAVRRLSAIPFFPSDEYARDSIMEELAAFVPNAEALTWLVRMALAGMRQWQGCAELRALHCTRYRPADGYEGGACSVPGHAPADHEVRPVLKATTQLYLPVPDDTKISDEEGGQIEALGERMRLPSGRLKQLRRPDRLTAYLERL
jgi:hypothetical protein